MAVVKAVAEGERPLVVVLQAAAVACEAALDEVVGTHVRFEISRKEAGGGVFGSHGCEGLAPSQDFPPVVAVEAAGKCKRVVRPSPERTVELGMPEVGTDTRPRQAAERHAIHLIQGRLGIARTVAAAQIRVDPNLFRDFHAYADTESLKEILVEQTGADQPWIESRDIAEVGVIEIEIDTRGGLHAHGQEAATDARAWSRNSRIAARAIGL